MCFWWYALDVLKLELCMSCYRTHSANVSSCLKNILRDDSCIFCFHKTKKKKQKENRRRRDSRDVHFSMQTTQGAISMHHHTYTWIRICKYIHLKVDCAYLQSRMQFSWVCIVHWLTVVYSKRVGSEQAKLSNALRLRIILHSWWAFDVLLLEIQIVLARNLRNKFFRLQFFCMPIHFDSFMILQNIVNGSHNWIIILNIGKSLLFDYRIQRSHIDWECYE